MKVTLQDIADKLSISRAAVSMALNDKTGISPELKERVYEQAKKMGYKMKKAKPTRTEIVVLYYAPHKDNIEDPIFGALISRINSVAHSENCSISIKNMNAGQRFLKSDFTGISGILIMGSFMEDTEDLNHIRSFNLPVLLLDCYIPGEDINSVTIDNRGAITSSVNWLANNGHTKIAFLSMNVSFYNSHERIMAFCESMRKYGLDPMHMILLNKKEGNSFSNWLDMNNFTATALIAESDYTAYIAMSELSSRGFVIGRDVSIIGLDDLPYSSVCIPPLSSANPNSEIRGEIALRRLLELIESPEQTFTHTQVGTHLVIRASSKPQTPPQS